MLPKNCGKLLYNAVRETLETMAFAEVIPCSIKVDDEEFAQDDDFAVVTDVQPAAVSGWGDEEETVDPVSNWGTASPKIPVSDSWGDPDPVPPENHWGEPGKNDPDVEESAWGNSGIHLPAKDPWGDAALADQADSQIVTTKEVSFDNMIAEETDWCWACMKVNSPDVHSVWFIVSKGLANALALNMYAGEITDMNTPLIRDLIAELTNVLGGRLMLLLEEMGGEFTLTVPEIGFGLPDIPETQNLRNIICKVVVDGTHPVIAALCFNPGGVLAAD
jgi:hypothetical protein